MWVLVYALKKDAGTLAIARKVLERFRSAGANMVLAERLGVKYCASPDVVVTIGGDGTVLSAAGEYPEALIFGVHKGDVGFLTEIEASDIEKGLEAVALKRFSVDPHSRVAAYSGKELIGVGLNEVVITSKRPAEILELSLRIDGNPYGPFSADGVIVSTPTGSTGYAMSAGGPAVESSCKVLNIVPVCPYNSGTKALVVPESSKIEVQVKKGTGIVAIDGKAVRTIKKKEWIVMKKASSPARFIRLKKHFYRKISELCR